MKAKTTQKQAKPEVSKGVFRRALNVARDLQALAKPSIAGEVTIKTHQRQGAI